MILHEPAAWQDHVTTWFQIGYNNDDLRSIPYMPDRLVPGCAVAVCTYMRAQSLSRFFDSLRRQSRLPDQLIIVDASPDEETHTMLRTRTDLAGLARHILYFRVRGPLKGITRQRNFALRCVLTDRVAFFDDDVILDPACIGEMENVLRTDGIVGVGASLSSEAWQPSLRWRMKRLLRIVPQLAAGRYWRSGMGTPWAIAEPTDAVIEGDFLPGAGMMWKTDPARRIGFCEEFVGYAQGEDLDFSLRMRHKGKLVMAGQARLEHLCDPNGRPGVYETGYMQIYNHFRIHRRAITERSLSTTAWFVYAWSLDTLFLTHNLLRPRKCWYCCKLIAGRLRATWDIVRRYRPLPQEEGHVSSFSGCRPKISNNL